MYKKTAITLFLALVMAGCGQEKLDLPAPGGEINATVPFILPGSVFRLEAKRNESTYGKYDYTFDRTQWGPKGWSLWVAANVYSSATYPGDGANSDTKWRKAEQTGIRATQDDRFLYGIKQFVRDNNVDLQINYLGYDNLPTSLVTDWPRSRGFHFAEYGEKCESGFKRCVDNYFLSPVDRLKGGGRMAYKDWIQPYFHFQNDQLGTSYKENFTSKGGDTDEQSEFYDWWPTMVFLVNPEGQAVRAWMPQTQSAGTVGEVEAALIHELNLKNVKLDKTYQLNRPTVDAYYGKFFVEQGLDDLLETLSGILKK